jgi:1-acyl-sn-glycerol-3-phosphate acyltransferase
MKIIRVTWYIIKVLVFWILSILYFIVALFVRLIDLWKAKSVFVSNIHLYFRLFGLNVNYQFSQTKIKEAYNSVFIILNQSSFLDSLVGAALPVRKTRGIINIEFAFYPILGWFIAIFNFVIIRQLPKQAKNTLNRTDKYLRSGGNMIISIEGKRSKDGKLKEYKKGPVVMAINSQSDIVPIIIEGTYESLPYRSLYTQPGEIRVRILEPISTKGMTYDDRNLLKDQLRSLAHSEGLR